MKAYKIIIIILLFFQTSCGYKIVNNLDNFNFNIIDYKLSGEKKINNILEQNFRRFENNINSSQNYIIHSNSEITKSITSKNNSGEALTYNMEIIISLKIYENEKVISNISLKQNINYDNLESKFELKQYENILIQDLTDQIIIKINNHLNSFQ